MSSIRQKRKYFRSIFLGMILVGCFICIFTVVTYIQNTKPVSMHPFEIAEVVIDPGHGGFDGGAVGSSGTIEKDINLSVSNKLADILRFCGYKVVMTREQDEDIATKSSRNEKKSDMQNRLKIIDKRPGTMAISIHQNKFTDSSPKGAQVFYGVKNPQSVEIAQNIQDSIKNLIQNENTRQIKKSTNQLYLLYQSVSPIVMVECGFLSNPSEEALLKTDEHQSKLAFAIMAGLFPVDR